MRIRVLMAVLFLGMVALGIVFWTRPRTVVIPFPLMDPQNEAVTIQWETRVVPARRLAEDPRDHPGFRLAQIQCARCHLLPEPNQLPKETWPFVLTWMANYLGYRNSYGPFHPIVSGSIMPEEPLVSKEQFQTLAEYYLLFSPRANEMPFPPSEPKYPLTQFEPMVPRLGIPPGGLITMLYFDDAAGNYYIGRGTEKAVQMYNADGRLLLNAGLESEPVDLELIPEGFRVSLLGDFLKDNQKGQVIDFVKDAGQQPRASQLIESYPRLSQTISHDLNQDGVEDLLLIGFGAGEDGKVSIFWRNPDGSIGEEKTLIEYSGALNAEIHDFDNDGLEDIMLLTSQSKQELLLFLNEGNGNFRQRILSKQFAGYGYNHFSIHDFNGDGRMDLLIENGNNMEIKNAPVKPYHGVRILENNGDLTFTEKYFYPLPGAMKAIAEDFDQDGDLDIAAIAFYPDWSLEYPETFVYLENRGNYQFRPYALPEEHWGRWLTMTTGDVDHDGYRDLILGGGYIRQGVHTDYYEEYEQRTRRKPTIVVLKNTGSKGK